jgi:tRNA-2-methylthio-N6-dimethylallyladenosine synthase
MARKLFIQTHGCQMNEYDSTRMVDLLESTHNLEPTDNPEDADVLLLNTCSIREKAQEKVFHQLGRWKRLKERNPELIIGVGGCVASQEGEAIRERAPYVDVVFGPQTLHRLPGLITQAASTRSLAIDVTFPEIEKFDNLPEPSVDGPSAFVSIMEGCSKYCTFCVVPYTRGEEVSRPVQPVLDEIRHLADMGVREINLLGQNVNAYRGQGAGGETLDLADLILLIRDIDGIDRIRYTTSHPVEFSDALIQVYEEVPELVSHLHLPVQSGSDRILAMMKRNHTVLEYKSKLRKLRRIRPDISYSSDFIIGFPGETDADFEATMNLIGDIGFDTSFSFIYSARPGTPAAELPDDVPLAVKKERLRILQQRLSQNAQDISRKMVGSTQRIRVVNFACDDIDLIGDFVDVEIVEALPNSLRGGLPVTA